MKNSSGRLSKSYVSLDIEFSTISTRSAASISLSRASPVPIRIEPLPRWLCVATGNASSARFASVSVKPASINSRTLLFAHHQLGARARRHAFGFDPDRAPHARTIRMRDTDERVRFLAALAAHGRPTFEPELRAASERRRATACCECTTSRAICVTTSSILPGRSARARTSSVASSSSSEKRDMCTPRFIGREVGDHRKLAVKRRFPCRPR